MKNVVHSIALSQVFLIAAPMMACSSTQSAKTNVATNATDTQHVAAATAPDDAMPMSALDGNLDTRPLYFGFDHHMLSEQQTVRLSRIANHMLAEESTFITIEGHCDDRGDSAYNLALGERRGQAARDFLVRSGVDAKRIKVVSYGEELPLAQGTSEASRAKNRRDEFTLTLAKGPKTALADFDPAQPKLSAHVIWVD